MNIEFEVTPGTVEFAGSVVWECTTLDNESHDTQVAETAARFAERLSVVVSSVDRLLLSRDYS